MNNRDDLHLTPTTEQIAEKRFLIMGNPNSGKTALFNRLTGRHHKISNFPGVTVERRTGYLKNRSIRIDDLPGAYSLKPQGFDEQIVAEIVHGWRQKGVRPDGIILVVDATNFSRTMFFALQVMEWDIPSILVINMIDEARDQGVRIDTEKLQLRLGADAVICTSAKSGEGIVRMRFGGGLSLLQRALAVGIGIPIGAKQGLEFGFILREVEHHV